MKSVDFPFFPSILRRFSAGTASRYTRTLAPALFFLCGSVASFGAVNDVVVRFSTPGVDRYSDGTVVADGECYALVWSPAGKAFSGFNADGTAASSSDRVVLAAPLAQDGRCIDCIFQVPAAEAAALEGGTWSVCLVDTRTAAGVPAGTANGLPRRVNRWGSVNGGVRVSSKAIAPASVAAAAKTRAVSSGVRASTLSEVPASAATPVITEMEIVDEYAVLSVADTVPFLTYTVESSETLDGFAKDRYADRVDGRDGGEITLVTDAPGTCRFFRITRAE